MKRSLTIVVYSRYTCLAKFPMCGDIGGKRRRKTKSALSQTVRRRLLGFEGAALSASLSTVEWRIPCPYSKEAPHFQHYPNLQPDQFEADLAWRKGQAKICPTSLFDISCIYALGGNLFTVFLSFSLRFVSFLLASLHSRLRRKQRCPM